MKISKNSWHYRTYRKVRNNPDNTNLCNYVQSIALSLTGQFLYYVVIWGLGSLLMTAAWPIIALLILIHGYYPTRWSALEDDFAKKYPPILAFGKKLYPAHAVTPLAFLALGSFFYQIIPAPEWGWETILSLTPLAVMSCVITWGSYEQAKKGTHGFPNPPERPKGAIGLVWEYAKAKKSRVCPLVTFVDESQN